MCIHSMCSTKFSYCFLLHRTPIGWPEQTSSPSLNFQVSSAVLMLSQPVRSRPLNRSTNCGTGDWAASPSGSAARMASVAKRRSVIKCETISAEMTINNALPLVTPRVAATLHPEFRPAVLAVRAFDDLVARSGRPVPVRLALEQTDGSVFHFRTRLLPADHPHASANATHLERFVKFILWSRGGWRIHVDGPAEAAAQLSAHYRETATGRFDSNFVGERIFDHPLTIVHTADLPPERSTTRPLGRHLEGCRIGFDLGGSERKVASVIDGRVVFSEETVWDPYHKPDPQYHYDGIVDSLTKAAAHLPRVDAIGGSAAGVYVNNRVKAGSLFRGVAPDLFE